MYLQLNNLNHETPSYSLFLKSQLGRQFLILLFSTLDQFDLIHSADILVEIYNKQLSEPSDPNAVMEDLNLKINKLAKEGEESLRSQSIIFSSIHIFLQWCKKL